MPKSRHDLLQGTLDLLILKTLALGPMHGWGIAQRIQQTSDDVLRVNQGSLYPALQRLETAGWVDAEWGVSDSNRQAKFYRLTRAGQKQLREEAADWARFSGAVGRILANEG
ncbi:MAG: PadR family transcriptional regulator [Vicinamibacteria bacterium]